MNLFADDIEVEEFLLLPADGEVDPEHQAQDHNLKTAPEVQVLRPVRLVVQLREVARR